MPGQTNNQTILAAENQQVDALNDIEQAIINLSSPVVTVDFSGLETAISALGVTLAGALEALSMQVTQINNCGCCGSSGTTTTTPTTPAPTPGSGVPGAGGPGDPPPPGTTIPSGTPQEIKTRQCKAAIFIVDDLLIKIVKGMDGVQLDYAINLVANSVETVLYVTGAIEAAAAVFTSVVPPVAAALVGTAALQAAIATATNLLEVDFSDLIDWLEENREKLICALANSDYPGSARVNLNFVINSSSPNLSPGNQLFLNNLLPPVAFDFLFYLETQFRVLEPKLTAITEPCPCDDIDPVETTPTDDYKCKAANYIFDSFTDTLTNFGGFSSMSWYSVATFISSLGSGLLSSTFTGIFGLIFGALGATIPQLISYLGTLFWRGTSYFTPFQLVAAEFETNKEAIICELYEAATVAAAREALSVHITDYVGSVMTANPQYQDAQQEYIDTITALLPNAVLNELFKTGAEERPEISGYAPADYYDCECGGSSDCYGGFSWAYGDCGDISVDGEVRTLTAVLFEGVYYIRVINSGPCCNVGVTVLSVSGIPYVSWQVPFEQCGDPGNYAAGVVQLNSERIGGTNSTGEIVFSFASSQPFSIEAIFRPL